MKGIFGSLIFESPLFLLVVIIWNLFIIWLAGNIYG